MKMKFIPLLFVVGCITVNSQITTIGGAKVFVSSGTTVFSTKDITIKSDTDLITNKGNIKISEGTLKNDAGADKFLMTYDNENDYGQLIITSGILPSASITMQRHLPNAGDNYVYFGTPLINHSYEQFTKEITGNTGATPPEIVCGLFPINNNCKNNPGRWNRQPVYEWREDRFRSDPFQGGDFIPGKYYTIRKKNFENIGANFANTISFVGVPYVAGTAPSTSISASPLKVGNRITNGYSIGNGARNEYGIFYYTYLNDPFAGSITKFDITTSNAALDEDKPNARFGDRMLHMVNPYTSNLDLQILTNNFTDIIGVGSEGPFTSDTDGKTRYVEKIQSFTVGSTPGIGDDLRIIPPMTNFFIKATKDNLTVDLYNASNAQTFKMGGYKFDNGIAQRDAIKTSSDKFQINLKLFSGETLYGNTYVAAGSDLLTGVINPLEARNNSNITDGTNIYTLAESETGDIAPGFEDSKLYINVINTDAAKVAIPVGVNIVEEDKGKEFTFKSDLRFNMNPLEDGKTNFDGSDEKFYFYDSETNVVKEIDTNFSYTVTLNESTNDRFKIFWQGVSEGMLGNEDINTLSGLTTIYKTGNEYKVRFDKNWKKADVNVFSVLGQLISSEKNITTQNDYLLPLYNSTSSMYVIVVVNSITGEKITKKIVK